jgi:glycosyltransferase involved in cell wall biosynthesis
MKLSVIIPAHNAGENLDFCLKALAHGIRPADELIVVDDLSTDGSIQSAQRHGACVLKTPEPAPVGPAAARNRGAAKATGEILVFIDADVVAHPDALHLIELNFLQNPDVSALFGSYDDSPTYRDMVSLYKNLQHHYVHQNGHQEASTFWSGIGAIRRDVFTQIGGFDESYAQPSIEDIELGVRLKLAGYRVSLIPNIQVTHRKRWDLVSLLRTDIFYRAIPWTRLILKTSQLPSDLNLHRKSKISAMLAWIFLFLVMLGFGFRIAWGAALVCLVTLISLNFPLYRFFYQRNGLLFSLGAIALHQLYYLYSSITFAILWIGHQVARY